MLLNRAGCSGGILKSSRYAFARYANTDAPSSGPRDLPGMAPKALPSRLKPTSASHFTGSPSYVDNVLHLENLHERILRAFKLYAIPYDSPIARDEIKKAQNDFIALKHPDMNRQLRTELSRGQYHSLTSSLSKVVQYRPFVKQHFASGDFGEREEILARELEETLNQFNRNADIVVKEELHHSAYLSASAHIDEQGRVYARGRRKEASARVWIIPKYDMSETSQLSSFGNSIIVNDKAIHEYFPNDRHRNDLIMPLFATGLLGVFNVFALTRGGGPTGQSGAIKQGIAKALLCYFDDRARKEEDSNGLVSPIALRLRQQAKIMRDVLVKQSYAKRDPRMVERKKTNRLKARKAPTWVKR